VSGTVQTEAPLAEPISLAEAKSWLHVDSTDEDVLITALIEAARTHVENFTRRALITQEFEHSLDAFPNSSRWNGYKYRETRGGFVCGREIALPNPPLQTVESIQYYDTNGTLQTFASSNYRVDAIAQPGRIVLDDNSDWPDVDERPNAVTIAYTAGYGTPSEVPSTLRVAMRFLISHWFQNRVHVNIGNIVNEIPDTVETLLWQHRIPEIY
jgi:uncharacterized phiE125 gp8 family phage protein